MVLNVCTYRGVEGCWVVLLIDAGTTLVLMAATVQRGMKELAKMAAETMSILSDMKADLPESAMGTSSWSRLNKLEDILMRLVATATIEKA